MACPPSRRAAAEKTFSVVSLSRSGTDVKFFLSAKAEATGLRSASAPGKPRCGVPIISRGPCEALVYARFFRTKLLGFPATSRRFAHRSSAALDAGADALARRAGRDLDVAARISARPR